MGFWGPTHGNVHRENDHEPSLSGHGNGLKTRNQPKIGWLTGKWYSMFFSGNHWDPSLSLGKYYIHMYGYVYIYMIYNTLYYIILQCILLHYIILYYITILYYTILYYITLYYIVLYIVLYYIILYHIILYYIIILCCIILYIIYYIIY